MSFEDKRTCTGCKRLFDGGMSAGKRTWWHCNGHHKITGFFCPQCYDMISHDSYGKPEDPEGYMLMLLKLNPKEVYHAS
jgi:hypothetical protein